MLRRYALPAGAPYPERPAPLGRILVRCWRTETSTVPRPIPALRLTLAGEERCGIDGRSYRLTAGRMMLIPAGTPMHVRSTGDGQGVSIELPAGCVDLPGAMLLPLTSHPIGGWLSDLVERMGKRDGEPHDAAATILRDVHGRVRGLVDACRSRMARIAAAKPTTRRDLLCRIEAARALLAANPLRSIPLGEIARDAGMSPYHLSRAFHDVIGQSPAAYRRSVRMAAAAALIRAGERPAVVAARMGFADQAGFSRAFVRHHGMTPGRYAKFAVDNDVFAHDERRSTKRAAIGRRRGDG